MATQYVLKEKSIEPEDISMDAVRSGNVVQVFTPEEFDEIYAPAVERSVSAQSVIRTAISHADIYGDWSAGVISVPSKEDVLGKSVNVGFLIDAKHLVFVDSTPLSEHTLDMLIKTCSGVAQTPGRMLFYALERFIAEDPKYLEEFESHLEQAEERIVDMDRAQADRTIAKLRRQLLRLNAYYEQLEDIGELMEDNENEVLDDTETHLFSIFARHAHHLGNRTRLLKEYSMQLYEMQQTQIDIKQNETMRWLTVITSIFVPLTLITSWYGMNFQYMPELAWPNGYVNVIIICAIVVIAELIFFKHRKWL